MNGFFNGDGRAMCVVINPEPRRRLSTTDTPIRGDGDPQRPRDRMLRALADLRAENWQAHVMCEAELPKGAA